MWMIRYRCELCGKKFSNDKQINRSLQLSTIQLSHNNFNNKRNRKSYIMGSTMGKSGSNFLDVLPSQGTLHVVMLGLDSAGKTTALYRLKFEQYLNTVPTIGFNCEKVQGAVGKAKGVQFLVWDVGGQEKLRPLWRSYTRCTDGILFVVDSVDIERMEEAKIELMRTAKCPDNQGVPVLILANKQDLPGARDTKELEKLLGLHELVYPNFNLTSMSSSSSSTGNIVGSSSNNSCSSSNLKPSDRSLTPTAHQCGESSFSYGVTVSSSNISKELSVQFPTLSSSVNSFSNTSLIEQFDGSISTKTIQIHHNSSSPQPKTVSQNTYDSTLKSSPSSVITSTAATTNNSLVSKKIGSTSGSATTNSLQFKGWYIQPACAITGEGLQEGLEALYEMILKRRKLNKAHKKKR